MDKFFQQFKDNLENQPEPPFGEKDWQSLSERLKPKREKRPLSMWLLWCLTPLFLMSLLSNYIFYSEMKKAQQKTASLTSRMDSVFHKIIVFQTDTIYKFHTIYEHDTIYKTKVLKQTWKSPNPLVFENAQNPTQVLEVNSPHDSTNKMIIGKTDVNPAMIGLNNNSTDNTLNLKGLDKVSPMPTTLVKIKRQQIQPTWGLLPIVQNHHKTLRQRIEVLRPKDYNVGISAGLAFPYGNGSSQPSGYALGLNGAAFFSKNGSIWAEVQYVQLSYKVDKMGDAIGVPIVPPPSNSFNFNGAFIKQPTIQYLAGIRYRFDRQKLWQPFMGLGFGAVTSLPYEVGYEFKNNSLGTVWDIDQTVNRKGTQVGFLMFEGGLEKRLSKQYRWQFGANYRVNLLSNGVQKHKLLGVKSSILFDF